MIKSRTRGILTLQGLIILFILPLLFLFEVFIAVEYVHKIIYAQVNFPLYLMGIVFARLLIINNSYRSDSRRTSGYLWVEAIRQTNSNTVILAMSLFAIVYATKDEAMSRLFLGFFILSTWIFLLPINRFLPIWLTRLLFRGENAIRTILVGSPSATKYLEEWITDDPPLGIEVTPKNRIIYRERLSG